MNQMQHSTLARSPLSGQHLTPSEYTIGDLAREFTVSLRALRFYEDRGLLHPRRQGLARYYSAADRVRLQMILKGKQLGFTLTEIRELLGNDHAQTEKPAGLALDASRIVEQIRHLERQRHDIETAIVELRATQQKMDVSLTAQAV